MAIETIIEFSCIPKDILTTDGMLERLKARDRAEAMIKLYREQGDHRPAEEIGFELTKRSSDGEEMTETIMVGDLLAEAAILDEVSEHCYGCPVNRTNQPFGCVASINYPLSEAGELWLLQKLPRSGHPLLHIMLRGIEEYNYDGETARPLRHQEGVYMVSHDTLARPYVEEDNIVTSDQIFEMLFMVGNIQPGHAAMILLFFNIIPRDDLTPDDIFWLMNGGVISVDADKVEDELPLLIRFDEEDDATIRDFKHFFHALFLAYVNGVSLRVNS